MTKKQYIATKFDEKRLEKGMNISDIILSQYDNLPVPVNASDLYMPENEQDKMEAWLMKNYITIKKLPKYRKDREMAMLKLNLFPSGIKK